MFYTDIGDSELVYLTRSGNKEAKDFLIARYKKRIFGIINSFCKKNNLKNVDYEDYFHNCFIVFLKCLEKYDEEYNFYNYVENSIERELSRYTSKENFYKSMLSIDEGIGNCLDTVNDSSYSYIQSEVDSLINDNFDSIDRRIIELKLEGYSFSQIADILEMKKKNVYNRASVIKGVLKRKLKV